MALEGALEGKMHVGHCKMRGEINVLPLDAQARFYRGMHEFVNGFMEQFHLSSSALIEYSQQLNREAEYLEHRQKDEEAKQQRSSSNINYFSHRIVSGSD